MSGHSQNRIGIRRRRSAFGRLRLLMAIAAGAFTLVFTGESPPLNAAQDGSRDYRLDALDKVRLKIFEWRPSLDQVFEWKALNDEYVVSPGGTISLPMLGEIAARGRTTGELGKVVADSMRRRIGLSELPQVSVEVVQYRPFYILGKVQKPGEYAYRPGLDVLQALSLAEGMMRDLSTGQRLSREFISSQGEIRRLRLRQGALDAKRKRIEADLAGRDEVDFGAAAATTDAAMKQLMDRELDILRAQRAEYEARRGQVLTRQRHLAEEKQSVDQQLKVHESKTALAMEDLKTVQGLVNKKLAVEPRRIGALRNVHQVESDRLQLVMARLRITEEVDKTAAAMVQLEQTRRAELMQLLGVTQGEIEDVTAKLATAEQLLLDTAQMIPGGVAGADGLAMNPVYSILRTIDGKREQIAATESTPVLPGDTVKVELDVAAIAALARARQLGSVGPASQPGLEQRSAAPADPGQSRGAGLDRAGSARVAGFAAPALRPWTEAAAAAQPTEQPPAMHAGDPAHPGTQADTSAARSRSSYASASGPEQVAPPAPVAPAQGPPAATAQARQRAEAAAPPGAAKRVERSRFEPTRDTRREPARRRR